MGDNTTLLEGEKMNLIYVMIGGFFGSISRYSLGEWIHINNGYPLGTFSINLIGCFALGWLLTFISIKRIIKPQLSLLLGTGFIGSFTTFSTFSIETIQLLEKGHLLQALFYVLSSILFGILFSYIGWKMADLNNKKGEQI